MATIEFPVDATTYVERLLTSAKNAGCPRDQVERFLRAGYVPTPKQFEFHAVARQCDMTDGPTRVLIGGARGGSKSHMIMGQIGIDDCQRVDGLKSLFLRKIQKSASESFEDLVGRVLRNVPHSLTEGKIRFPNGSRIMVGGYKDASDIDKYLGIEYDVIAVEELTQLLGLKVTMLEGSLRTSRNDWRTRMYASTNPGGIGHADVKKSYIMPYRENRQELTRFIPATYKDNPFLDKEYVAWLEHLTGPLAKAWRDGDWDIFEGQAFPAWNHDLHVVDPFYIPDNWPRWRAMDWGLSAPFCCLWFAKDPDTGRIIIYREVYETMLTPKQQARMILDYSPANEHIQITYADPSMWGKKSYENVVTTTADEYLAEGLPLTKADNDRMQGKRKVDNLLANLPDGRPGLIIFRNCTNLIRTLPELVFDENKIEDVDTTQEDHAYDTVRYGLTNTRIQQQKREPAPNPWLKVKNI